MPSQAAVGRPFAANSSPAGAFRNPPTTQGSPCFEPPGNPLPCNCRIHLWLRRSQKHQLFPLFAWGNSRAHRRSHDHGSISRRPSPTSPSQRLRSAFAAVRGSFTWFGVRKSLNSEQKAQAAESFGAEGQYLSAAKKLLDRNRGYGRLRLAALMPTPRRSTARCGRRRWLWSLRGTTPRSSSDATHKRSKCSWRSWPTWGGRQVLSG